jgi:CubicO group peptidase (beta-lactamase class C family)
MVIPTLTPQYASQPDGVAWPTREWPRGQHPNQAALSAIADEAFEDDALAVSNAVVVIQHGRVLYERYGGVKEFFDRDPEPITGASELLSWSMAKSMLHFLVGTLVDEGRLTPTATQLFPEWDGDERRTISLGDLLAMRDGLSFVEDYVIGQTSDVIEMLFGSGRDDTAGYARQRLLGHTPGTVFNYSSGTSNIISDLVAREVGSHAAYESFIHDRLFGPLGMTSARATFDAAGTFVASSYVHATALDFAKFGLLYLRGGEWDGSRLVSRRWCDTAQTPLSRDEESGNFYSWQWWVTGDNYGTYWANGYEGQMISVVPALDALVVRFGHTDAERYPELRAWRSRVLEVLAH